jgi:catechol 2,3-dioxygenase-like lactoylglutathione lyase family enzyme
MITKFYGINISSPNPEQLARFYNEKLGVPILQKDQNGYDGAELGFMEGAPVIVIWDEKRWGKSSEGPVNFVFRCDDLDKTYEELRARGLAIGPPSTTDWGGKELIFQDPDGNKVLLL